MKKARPKADPPACPCGSGRAYAVYCGVFIDHGALPATAALLMRSRYSAYVLTREDYLLRTWHESTRPARLDLRDAGPVKWLGLKIVRAEAGGADDTHNFYHDIPCYAPLVSFFPNRGVDLILTKDHDRDK